MESIVLDCYCIIEVVREGTHCFGLRHVLLRQ